MALKVCIADDDAGMRLVLSKLIRTIEGLELCGEAENGEEALELCLAQRPDIILLDVEMPVMSGTEAARRLSSELPEAVIIFVTAHSEFMPEAFEVYALDYLLKPFKADRVRQTLQRAAQHQLKRAEAAPALIISSRDEISLVPIPDIIMVYRDGRVSRIILAEGEYSSGDSLGELWTKLEPEGFIRSHRAYIVNPRHIAKILPYGRWSYNVLFKGCEKQAMMTREKFDELQILMSRE